MTAAHLELKMPMALRSPNDYLGVHWREKHRERTAWTSMITAAVIEAVGVAAAQRLLGPAAPLPGCHGGCVVRRRVEVTRLAPTRARFLKDDDNLRFCVKPLLDAMKRVGLIRDDRRAWVELPDPRQALSTDGQFWTWVTIGEPTGAPS